MKNILSMGALFLTTPVLAHPGHGKPGFLHFHEFSDGLLIGVALIAVALLAWAWKK